MTKFVLDTSIIIDGEITKMLEAGEIEGGSEIIIPLAVLDELQAQASTNKEHGFVGLAEIKKMRELASARSVSIARRRRRTGIVRSPRRHFHSIQAARSSGPALSPMAPSRESRKPRTLPSSS